MNNEGKCAIKLVHGLPNLEPSRNVSSKVINRSLWMQPHFLTIKQGYKLIHRKKKIVAFFIMLYLP